MNSLTVTGLERADRPFTDTELVAMANHGGVLMVRDLLGNVEIPETATHCTAIAERGAYRASIPLDEMLRGGQLTVRHGGAAISADAGGPYRLTVLDGATLCWNVKNVEELRVSRGPLPDDVPANPTH